VKPIRLSPSLTFWALAVVTLLLSHDAVWLAQVGPGAQLTGVLRQAGHGYWGLASAVLLLVGALALTGTALSEPIASHEGDGGTRVGLR
jgi:hypothetical protein